MKNKESKTPDQTQKDLEELKITISQLSKRNTELETRVQSFEEHIKRMLELERKIDLKLQTQDRIEWEKAGEKPEDVPEEEKKKEKLAISSGNIGAHEEVF